MHLRRTNTFLFRGGRAENRGAYAERLFALTADDYILSYGGGPSTGWADTRDAYVEPLFALTPNDYFPKVPGSEEFVYRFDTRCYLQ